MNVGEVIKIFNNMPSSDVALVASALGTFVATFCVSLWNGFKLLSIGKATVDIQNKAEESKDKAAEASKKVDKVQDTVSTIKIEINGRIKELIEAKEQAARLEADLNARVSMIEKHSFNWLSVLVESSRDAMVGKSIDGMILSWNRSAEELFGYSKSEIIGKYSSVLFEEDNTTEEKFILDQVRNGVRFDNFNCKRKKKDGTVIDLEATITPVVDLNGSPIGLCAVYRPKVEEDLGFTREVLGHGELDVNG